MATDGVGGSRPGLTLAAVAALFVALTAWLVDLDGQLRNEVASAGIVSFELAGSAERASAILASWDQGAREAAMLLQGLDYLYLLVYPALLYLLVARVGSRLGGAWEAASAGISRSVLLCCPLDAVENHALIAQLTGGAAESLARRAWLTAAAKFGLLSLAIAFLVAAAATSVLRRGGRAV